MKAPREALTAVNTTAFSTSAGAGTHLDGSATTVLDNMRTRINEIEAALKSLGLIK